MKPDFDSHARNEKLGRGQILIAIGGEPYDGVLLRIIQDIGEKLLFEDWHEYHNFEDFLDLEHDGHEAGIYLVDFDLYYVYETWPSLPCDTYLKAVDVRYQEATWPEGQIVMGQSNE